MRLDRFITLNVVRPWRRVLRSLNPQPSTLNSNWTVPVLMYHSISDDPEPNFSPYYKVNTSPTVFRQHMQLLADLGYRTVTVSELVNRMGSNNKETKEQREQETGDRRQETGVRGEGTGDRGQESGGRCQETGDRSQETVHQSSTINSQRTGDRRQESGVDRPPSASQLTVALTFDDGFRDFYTEAFPVLQEFCFTATMFLPTAFIGNERRHFRPAGSKPPGVRGQETGVRRQESGDRNQETVVRNQETGVMGQETGVMGQETGVRIQETGDRNQETGVGRQQTINHSPSTSDKQCLTWPEVRELRKAGIEFGSHTVNHPKLVDLDLDTVRSELTDSKATIERELGEPITAFCYPYAFPQNHRGFVENLTRLLVETGYLSCATTKLGRCTAGDDPYSLRRLPANSLDDRPILLAKLDGAYDWIAKPQAMLKFAKRCQTPRDATY